MQIKKISLHDFSDAFNKSYDTGEKYYFFFVMVGMLDILFNALIESSVIHTIFTTFFSAGLIFIAQTAIEDGEQPSLSQYFAAFTRGQVMQRLKSIVLFNVILTMAMSYAAGFILVHVNELVSQTVMASSPFVMFWYYKISDGVVHLALASMVLRKTSWFTSSPFWYPSRSRR